MSLNNDLHSSKKAKARHDIHNFGVTFFSMENRYHKTLPMAPGDSESPKSPSLIMGHNSPKESSQTSAKDLAYTSPSPRFIILKQIDSRRSHKIVETKKVKEFKARKNDKIRREQLDILEEWREITSMRESHYNQKMEMCYNKRVRPSTFKPGTYALRLNSASKAEFQGNMGPT
ncbi:hypothetical protein Tco_0363321 [Tanacetum coccineum]